MESFLQFICAHAHDAWWILFCLLMLAGLNVPISEDLVLLIAGIIGSTCLQGEWHHLFFWVWLGSYVSAWEAYWVGRLLGPKLYKVRWFGHVITPHRIERINHYYEKFGIFTFVVGRFCPGGIRNALFMTAGLGKMPFPKFIFRDGIACFFSSNVLFHIGFQFGKHHEALLHYFFTYEKIVLTVVCVAIATVIGFIWFKKKPAV
jgi:membrane-associated protein